MFCSQVDTNLASIPLTIVFKTFKSFLNLFQADDPINEMLFRPKLVLHRCISKVICDLVIYIGERVYINNI